MGWSGYCGRLSISSSGKLPAGTYGTPMQSAGTVVVSTPVAERMIGGEVMLNGKVSVVVCRVVVTVSVVVVKQLCFV
jgi:hypothetical protein